MKKRMYASIISCGLLSSAIFAGSGEAATFSDVPEQHRFYQQIKRIQEQEVIQGYSDGTFRPQQPVTRGEVAIIVGSYLKVNADQGSNFKDISSSFVSRYVEAGRKNGYINGYSDSLFKPQQTITRAELAIVLSKAFNLEPSNTNKVSFHDVSEKMTSYRAILALAEQGITSGYEDGSFRPSQNVTRGELAAFLSKIMEHQSETAETEGYIAGIDGAKIWVVDDLQGNTPSNLKGKTWRELLEKFNKRGIIFTTGEIDESVLASLKVGQKVNVIHTKYLYGSQPPQGEAFEITPVE